MMLRLAIAALVNNVQANMATEACRTNMGILFTSRKLRSIHSESVPRSRSIARPYSYAEKKNPS